MSTLARLPDEQRTARDNAQRDLRALESAFGKFADIRMPTESEEPILAPGPRVIIFEWMKELQSEEELTAHGLKPRRKALLYGPPGTGKTTLAHHLSARMGLPLICVRSEGVIQGVLGGTGSNIGALFDAMRQFRNKVAIFFDEFDALAGKRMNDQGASVERANSVNVLLRRMEQDASLTFAATNRRDHIDTAVWRRFDMQISVDLPEAEERFAIIKRYIAPLDPPDEDVDALVEATADASPALLEQLMKGVKRALILWPRLKRPLDAFSIFTAIVAGISPPPEMVCPPLWLADFDLRDITEQFTWPWNKAEPS